MVGHERRNQMTPPLSRRRDRPLPGMCVMAALDPKQRRRGLTHIDLTTDPDNVASQRVILNNGGALIERFQKPPMYGGGQGLRFRIPLTP